MNDVWCPTCDSLLDSLFDVCLLWLWLFRCLCDAFERPEVREWPERYDFLSSSWISLESSRLSISDRSLPAVPLSLWSPDACNGSECRWFVASSFFYSSFGTVSEDRDAWLAWFCSWITSGCAVSSLGGLSSRFLDSSMIGWHTASSVSIIAVPFSLSFGTSPGYIKNVADWSSFLFWALEAPRDDTDTPPFPASLISGPA